jgi:glycerol-3-phosphate dehydrogenase
VKRDVGALAGRTFDVLVVGGGVQGAAVAWEAARRGMSVALVEAEDFGAGVSWNSLRTLHGGMRHLQRGHLRALRQSARDRADWMRLAPAVVRPLPFLVPARGHGARGREALALGVAAAHALSAGLTDGLPGPRLLGAGAVRGRLPGLDPAGLSGGVIWHDAQAVASERLVIGLVSAAAAAGAAAANHARVEAIDVEGGRVAGAVLRDGLGGGRVSVRARATVNAAGAGLEPLLHERGWRAADAPWLRAVNLVLRRPAVAECAVGGETGGRFLFLVPWRDRAIVGTGYAPVDADPAGARRALLRDAQAAFPWAGLEAADVALVHEGLVPGRSASDLAPVSRVVDHAAEGGPGLASVVAAKFTGALSTARRLVDLLGAPPAAPAPLARARALDGPLETRTREAVRDEMALTLADVVLRRLDLGSAGPPPEADLGVVAASMAAELGWDPARVAAERQALAGFYEARRIG